MRANLTIPDVKKPFTFQQTPPGGEANTQSFNLALEDKDSATLYVRFFVDGFPYEKVVGEATATNCTSSCSVIVDIKGLCDEVVNSVLGTHIIEAYIVDQLWADRNNENLTIPEPGGFRTNALWRFDCIEPVGTSDGGV